MQSRLVRPCSELPNPRESESCIISEYEANPTYHSQCFPEEFGLLSIKSRSIFRVINWTYHWHIDTFHLSVEMTAQLTIRK